MPVVHSRDKSHRTIVGDGSDQVMPWVPQEEVGQFGIDWIIEYAGQSAAQQGLISIAQQADNVEFARDRP